MDNSTGKLYMVPTPIGNLKDITLRALEVLSDSDIIAAEDTRQTLKLLNHYNIKKTLISYHQHNEMSKSEDIIDMLKDGKTIALVTDAGTPGISDPGSVILKKCIERNIQVEVLPGAAAVITALVHSGLDTSKFIFRGFLPRDKKERKEVILELADRKETLIFYEAPHRLLNTLEFLLTSLGDRNISVCRELTKLHEEILRTTISGAIEKYTEINPKGEFVLVIEGISEQQIEAEKAMAWNNLTMEDHIKSYISKGLSKKEAIKQVAKERDIPKSEVYKHSLEL